MRHDPTIAGMLLGLAHDFELRARVHGEPMRDDDLLSDQVRYLEDVLNGTQDGKIPRPIAQARGRDERH